MAATFDRSMQYSPLFQSRSLPGFTPFSLVPSGFEQGKKRGKSRGSFVLKPLWNKFQRNSATAAQRKGDDEIEFSIFVPETRENWAVLKQCEFFLFVSLMRRDIFFTFRGRREMRQEIIAHTPFTSVMHKVIRAGSRIWRAAHYVFVCVSSLHGSQKKNGKRAFEVKVNRCL